MIKKYVQAYTYFTHDKCTDVCILFYDIPGSMLSLRKSRMVPSLDHLTVLKPTIWNTFSKTTMTRMKTLRAPSPSSSIITMLISMLLVKTRPLLSSLKTSKRFTNLWKISKSTRISKNSTRSAHSPSFPTFPLLTTHT